jgi:hypothetical protein
MYVPTTDAKPHVSRASWRPGLEWTLKSIESYGYGLEKSLIGSILPLLMNQSRFFAFHIYEVLARFRERY